MKIKVCGITLPQQLQQLNDLPVDLAGLIFYKGSPRCVKDDTPTDFFQQDFNIKKVGVFVNAGYDEIMSIADKYALDFVQLHGDESPLLCTQLSGNIKVIKAFRINQENESSIALLLQQYENACDHFLFDTASKKGFGGTGEKFNWNIFSSLAVNKPFLLSGGISADDAERVKQFTHPRFAGIDINSRFETSPGIKDMNMVKQFVSSIKEF